MNEEIVKIDIYGEMDIYLAQRYILELGHKAGMKTSEQTRLATAVSEIIRNMIEYAGEGKLTYSITSKKGYTFFEAQLNDEGPGIDGEDMQMIQAGKPLPRGGNRGVGLANVRRLINGMEINSDTHGTQIKISHPIPSKGGKISPELVKEWKAYFKDRKTDNPYEEVKIRNRQLVDLAKELQKSNEDLRLAQDRELENTESFQFVANNTTQIILKAGPSRMVHFSNKYWHGYTGLSENMVAKTGWQQAVHPDDIGRFLDAWDVALIRENTFECELRLRRSDGEYLWHLFRAEAIRNTNGHIVMWVLTGFNIDNRAKFSKELEDLVHLRTLEITRANKELEHKNEQLEKMNAELQSFSYVSSHDLQEPLRKIQIFSGRMLGNSPDDLNEKNRYYLKRIKYAADRMRLLIGDLLTYSRTNTLKYAFETIDFNQIINDMKEEMKDVLDEKDAILNFHGEAGMVQIVPFQFRQLLHNLIANSLKFYLPGRKPVIDILSENIPGSLLGGSDFLKDANYFHLSVQDNGIGFDSKFSTNIFNLFQRLHDNQEYSGTGIGLAIVKKIVQSHNGVIRASGEPDKGAKFDIYVPVIQPEPEQDDGASKFM